MEFSEARIKQLVVKHFTEYSNPDVFHKVLKAFIKEFTSEAPNLENLIQKTGETLNYDSSTAKSFILELLALLVKCIHHKIAFNDQEFTDDRLAFVRIFREALMKLSRNSTFLSYIAQFDTYFARHLTSSDFQFEMESKFEPHIEMRWRMKMDDGEEREVMLSPAMVNKMVEETSAALQAMDSMKRRQQMRP